MATDIIAVLQPYASLCYVLAVSRTAHKLYPLRVRLVNDVSGEVTWATIAYIPMVRKQTETSADERSRLRRCGILQRVMYMCMRSAIAASHNGVEVHVGHRVLKAFPRLLLYVCDQLEERAVLCLKTGQCQRPCSQCDVSVDMICEAEALTAEERDVVYMLERQLEASGHRQHNRERQRRETLESVDSLTGFVPALAGMAGLSTTPYLLYKMIGFDALHVRCFSVCSSDYVPFVCHWVSIVVVASSSCPELRLTLGVPFVDLHALACVCAGSGSWRHEAAGTEAG